MDKELRNNVLNEYKYGKINLFEACKILKKVGMSEENSMLTLSNIHRENIIFISEFFKNKHLSKNAKIKDGDYLFEIYNEEFDENNKDEYFFEIEFEE